MDVVLEVAVTDTAAQLTMTDAVTGEVLDYSVIDFANVPDAGSELAATIQGTHQSLRDRGHGLVETRLDWADAAQAAALRDLLVASGLQGVTLAGSAEYSAGDPTMMAPSVDAATGMAPVAGTYLAYSEVEDGDAGGLGYSAGYSAAIPEVDVPLQTPLAPLNASAETDPTGAAARPRSLLVGSTVAGAAIVLVAAASVTLAINVRPSALTVAQEPDAPPLVFEQAIGTVPDTQGEPVVYIPPPPAPAEAVNPESTGVVYGDSASTIPPEGFIPTLDGGQAPPAPVGPIPPPVPGAIPANELNLPAPVGAPNMFAGLDVAQAVVQAVPQVVIPILNQPIAPRPASDPDRGNQFVRGSEDVDASNDDVSRQEDTGTQEGADISEDDTVKVPDVSTPSDGNTDRVPGPELAPAPVDVPDRPSAPSPAIDLQPDVPVIAPPPVVREVPPPVVPDVPVYEPPDVPEVPVYEPPDVPEVPVYEPPDVPEVPAYEPPPVVVPEVPVYEPPAPAAPALPQIPLLPQLPKIPFLPGSGSGSSGSSGSGSSDSGSSVPETLLPQLPFLGG